MTKEMWNKLFKKEAKSDIYWTEDNIFYLIKKHKNSFDTREDWYCGYAAVKMHKNILQYKDNFQVYCGVTYHESLEDYVILGFDTAHFDQFDPYGKELIEALKDECRKLGRQMNNISKTNYAMSGNEVRKILLEAISCK